MSLFNYFSAKKLVILVLVIVSGVLSLACSTVSAVNDSPSVSAVPPGEIELPAPLLKGNVSLEEALQARRSVRSFSQDSLTLKEVSQVLWAAQGKTAEWGGRTAPSAGALYPLDVYLISGNVQGLSPAIYRYNPEKHSLVKILDGDMRVKLSAAALNQSSVQDAAIDLVIAGVYSRTTEKYGDLGIRFVDMEAGHAAQNACLQVTALKLGAVTIGAFDNDRVKATINISEDGTPLYIIPIGKPQN